MKAVMGLFLALASFAATANETGIDPQHAEIVQQCGNAGHLASLFLREIPGWNEKAIAERQQAFEKLSSNNRPTPRQMNVAYMVIKRLHDRSNPEELEEMRQYGGYLMALEASHASALCTYGELNALGK